MLKTYRKLFLFQAVDFYAVGIKKVTLIKITLVFDGGGT